MSHDLATTYRAYIDCLNARDFNALDRFVRDEVTYNGNLVGLVGYRAMLERDTADIPDLKFHIDLLVTDPPHVAARLLFDCTPRATLFGIPVDGRRVCFSENVFYAFRDGLIADVRSVIDKTAIAEQLNLHDGPSGAASA